MSASDHRQIRLDVRLAVANKVKLDFDVNSKNSRIWDDGTSPGLIKFLETITQLRSLAHQMSTDDLTVAFHSARDKLIETDPSMEAVSLRMRSMLSTLGLNGGIEMYFYCSRQLNDGADGGKDGRLRKFGFQEIRTVRNPK